MLDGKGDLADATVSDLSTMSTSGTLSDGVVDAAAAVAAVGCPAGLVSGVMAGGGLHVLISDPNTGHCDT